MDNQITPREIPIMPTLIREIRKENEIEQIVDLDSKAEFLYDEFFPAPLPVHLSDIPRATYLTKIDCSKLIIKQKMKQTM